MTMKNNIFLQIFEFFSAHTKEISSYFMLNLWKEFSATTIKGLHSFLFLIHQTPPKLNNFSTALGSRNVFT